MSYRLIDANALIGEISYEDYEKVQNAPCIYADLSNGMDGGMYLAIPAHGATNGDMLKAMFPSLEIVDDFCHSIGVRLNNSNYVQFNKDWWNAPYNRTEE